MTLLARLSAAIEIVATILCLALWAVIVGAATVLIFTSIITGW